MSEISKVVSNVKQVNGIGYDSSEISRAVAYAIKQQPKEALFIGAGMVCVYMFRDEIKELLKSGKFSFKLKRDGIEFNKD